MPQEFWYPIDATTHDMPSGWNSGTTDTGNMNSSAKPGGGRAGPMTHDDDTSYTYITTNESWAYQCVNISWPGPMATYNGVFTGGCRDKMSGVGYSTLRYCYFVNAGGTANSAYVGVSDTNTSWTTRGPVDVSAAATYRPGGGSWGVADFQNDKTIFVGMGKANEPTGWHTGYWTSVWGEISYTPPAGGFVFMLGLAGALALPHVGRFPDFISFRRYLDWRERFHPRHTKWAPGEDLVAWRDVRAYHWPTHFVPA